MDKNFARDYALNWHMIVIYVLGLLYVAYSAAYQYLNPAHLDLQQATIQAVLAVLTLLLYGHLHYTKTALAIKQARIVDAQPPRANLYGRETDHP